jgi:hypothetical protein
MAEKNNVGQTFLNNLHKNSDRTKLLPTDQQYYKQAEGLAMGAPTSAILAETYIQHMEHKQI